MSELKTTIKYSDYIPPNDPSVIVNEELIPYDDDSATILAQNAMELEESFVSCDHIGGYYGSFGD